MIKANPFTFHVSLIRYGELFNLVEVALDELEIDSINSWFSTRDMRWIEFVPASSRNHDPALFDRLYGALHAYLLEDFVADINLLCWPERLLLKACGNLSRVKDPDSVVEIPLDTVRGEKPELIDEIEVEARYCLEDYSG